MAGALALNTRKHRGSRGGAMFDRTSSYGLPPQMLVPQWVTRFAVQRLNETRSFPQYLTVSSPFYGLFALPITVNNLVESAISRPMRGRCHNRIGSQEKVALSHPPWEMREARF
jgi:hypothetical protein